MLSYNMGLPISKRSTNEEALNLDAMKEPSLVSRARLMIHGDGCQQGQRELAAALLGISFFFFFCKPNRCDFLGAGDFTAFLRAPNRKR